MVTPHTRGDHWVGGITVQTIGYAAIAACDAWLRTDDGDLLDLIDEAFDSSRPASGPWSTHRLKDS